MKLRRSKDNEKRAEFQICVCVALRFLVHAHTYSIRCIIKSAEFIIPLIYSHRRIFQFVIHSYGYNFVLQVFSIVSFTAIFILLGLKLPCFICMNIEMYVLIRFVYKLKMNFVLQNTVFAHCVSLLDSAMFLVLLLMLLFGLFSTKLTPSYDIYIYIYACIKMIAMRKTANEWILKTT